MISRMDHAELVRRVSLVIWDYSEGKPVKPSIKRHGLRPLQFYNAINSDAELMRQYDGAKIARAELLGDQVLEIADDRTQDPQLARNRIQARQWLTKVLYPQIYGERMAIDLKGKVDLVAVMNEARDRVIGRTIDVQVIEDVKQLPSPSTDKQSVDVAMADPFAD